jgi:hypothetical protein
MSLSRITESPTEDDAVLITIDGTIDGQSLPILESLFEKHRQGTNKIIFSFWGLVNVDRQAKDFLKKVRARVQFLGLPDYLKMELFDSNLI